MAVLTLAPTTCCDADLGLEVPPGLSGPHSCTEPLPVLQGVGLLCVWWLVHIMGVLEGEA